MLRTQERVARQALARRGRVLDDELYQMEERAYARRRPPTGQGVRLSEADYRRAASSIPPWAFLASLTAVSLVAVFAVTAGEVPAWISVVLGITSLVIPSALGLWQVRLIKKQVEIAENAYALQRSSGPDRQDGAESR